MSLSKENKVVIDGQTYYGGFNQPNLKFIKVNVDCWEKIFNFLSLHDIISMSGTCQRMRQIGGHYFRENFHGTTCDLFEPSRLLICNTHIDRNHFLRFIDTLQVYFNLEYLRNLSSMKLLASLTTLRLYQIDLNEHQLNGFENLQANIETIVLIFCIIVDNSIGEFLALCPKLKCLQLECSEFQSPTGKTGLFQRTYPTLEKLSFYQSGEMDELISFLERNPNIKCLEVDIGDFLQISLDTATAQLDYLDITIKIGKYKTNELLNQLKTLHANGFFKKLRLAINNSIDDSGLFLQEMISFDALEVMRTLNIDVNAISQLSQLKELHLAYSDDDLDLKTLAMNLINLERLRIDGTVNQLSSFLCHSKKLKFIHFTDTIDGCRPLNVFNLNRVRQMGGMKYKVRIGLNQNTYFFTKSITMNMNHDLVEITRVGIINKHFDF